MEKALKGQEQKTRDAVARANKLQAEAETVERRWQAAQKDLLERLKVAEETIAPRRLQAKVREQWPTIESELQYFLEWVGENHRKIDGKKHEDVVAEYVAEAKND
jgi:hypothetical protein